MASRAVCLKCNSVILNDSEKYLKYEKCAVMFLHQSCSPYKPAELKVLENHMKNIKWRCDDCANMKNFSETSEILQIVKRLENNLKQCLERVETQEKLILVQNNKIDEQNKAIKSLTKKYSEEVLLDTKTNGNYRTRSLTRSTLKHTPQESAVLADNEIPYKDVLSHENVNNQKKGFSHLHRQKTTSLTHLLMKHRKLASMKCKKLVTKKTISLKLKIGKEEKLYGESEQILFLQLHRIVNGFSYRNCIGIAI